MKIRNKMQEYYRNGKQIKIETLKDEIREDLHSGLEPIDFDLTRKQFIGLLKGMGYRYERIKNRPQIYERSDLGKLRRNFLRLS